MPEYEEFRYRNKLGKITNFEEFIENTKKDLMLASEQGLSIYFDSYFFGTVKAAKTSPISYKIVDLDNIEMVTRRDPIKLYDHNLFEFSRTTHDFIKHFVEEENQHQYLTYLNI